MKILIVEDHPASRELLTLFLRNMGYETVEVENGDEAIAAAETFAPDLIFLDLSLPDINGVDVTAALKQNVRTSHIPIVVISALPASIWEGKSTKAGASAYLTKPASGLEMRQVIERITGANQELTN